ncbi:MAG: peptidase MA family metallohydrolase [Candidatus Hinthialibacter antarcticus]|nr:peptidase MA family metallohydrolase [Candidatus Hinthialibacter antarcticus]
MRSWLIRRNILPSFGTVCLLLCVFLAPVQLCAQMTEERHVAPNEHYRTLFKEGRYQDALTDIQRRMDERPELAESKAYRYIIWLSDRAAIRFHIGDVDNAIDDMEIVAEEYFEPVFLMRLAEMYQYRGRMDEYNQTINTIATTQKRFQFFHSREENFIVMGRAAELRGESPKQLLSTFYTNMMESRPRFIGGYLGAGDLSLRYGSYDLAEKYFTQALEVSETDEDALSGLTETYWKAHDPRLDEMMERLKENYSNNFNAWRIETEQWLDLGDTNKAYEIIEQALKVNPNHLLIRSLKAAAHFLDDDIDAMKKLQAQVLTFNPSCSDVFQVPGRIASRHYRFKEGAALQQQALAVNPDDHKARAEYALNLLRLGRDETGKENLETAFEADPYNVQSYNLLQMLDSLNNFVSIERGPFILQLPKDESAILANEMFDLLQEAYDLYQEKYQIELETPIHIQIFDNHDDFMVRSVGLPGNIGFMGICFGHLVTMDSPSAREPHTMNWASVLWHEFTHVVTLQKTNNRMPRWLSEGISVYEELERSPAWGQKMDLQYKQFIDSEDLPGVQDLETYFVQPKTGMHIMLGYFFSAEFVKFYTKQYGVDALVGALDLIAGGGDTIEALAQASDETIRSMDRGFASYLEERLAPYENLPAIETDKGVLEEMWDSLTQHEPEIEQWIDKDSPFTNAMREGMAALRSEEWQTAEARLQEAHELFPDYASSGAPLKMLIQLFEKNGEREKLKQTLQREVAWDSTDFDARAKLMSMHQKDEEWDAALEAAQLAIEIDPFDLNIRKKMLDVFIQLERYNEAAECVLHLQALDPARRLDYQMQRIGFLQQSHDWNGAKKEVVLVLEEFPHHRKAQEELLKIIERDVVNEN